MKVPRLLMALGGLVSIHLASAMPQGSIARDDNFPRNVAHSSSAKSKFASTSGLKFTVDGETGYFAGSNSYWIGFLTNNADVDLVFQHMNESGLKILRVWGFNDVNAKPAAGTVWYQLHANGTSTINTGPDGLQRLDYVVRSAEQHGIKLIINFVNNWNDYGGINSYLKAYGGSTNADFYNSKAMQKAYKAYVKAVVSRYIDSPAVFAWELANEPRCNGCDTSVLYSWIRDTSKYIKSLDKKHMVTTGEEGFGLDLMSDGSYPFTYVEGNNFTSTLSIPTIDFATFHLYPSSWGTTNEWGNLWVTSHGAACKAAGKPCLFEEYGVTSDHCTVEKPWQETALNTTGVSGDLYWQYGDTLSTGLSPDDGNTFYYGTAEFDCLVTEHVADIASMRKYGRH
ncbi:putative mannan endo-1,4-beta-mannosidase A-2 [Aspergillus ambiguus]|uniref:glycoside hydrolase 5 family protein n=1 Tax=Aspergillus ambiguus TaxID=176160 RepID=UPI003CCD4187